MACLLYNTGKCLQLRMFNRPNFGVHFSTCPRVRPDNFRQIHLFAKEEQDMYVVGGSPHLYGRTPVVIENLRHIRVHLRQMLFRYRVRPPLGGEH